MTPDEYAALSDDELLAYLETITSPMVALQLVASRAGDEFRDLDVVPADESVERAAAADLLTRVALGHETLASALVQLRKVDP